MEFDLIEFGKVFGLPGLLIAVWYLLERDKGKRAEKAEEQRNTIELRKADAMTVGFQSLSGKIDASHTANIQSHGEFRADLARIDGKLDAALDLTPQPQQIPTKRHETPSRGVRTGVYGLGRSKTSGEG